MYSTMKALRDNDIISEAQYTRWNMNQAIERMNVSIVNNVCICIFVHGGETVTGNSIFITISNK